ncbi:hypothetical protein QP157_20810 [Sphingomonas sp. LR61]|uniref:hypothetical protein n=1 Tax=Sphingomonas sp. LR61 TaxID=3050234 RepID=UPI002FE3009A
MLEWIAGRVDGSADVGWSPVGGLPAAGELDLAWARPRRLCARGAVRRRPGRQVGEAAHEKRESVSR